MLTPPARMVTLLGLAGCLEASLSPIVDGSDADSDTLPDHDTDSDTDADRDTGRDSDTPPDRDTGGDRDTGSDVDPQPAETLSINHNAVCADLAVSRDGTRLYATRPSQGDLIVVSTADLSLITSIPVAGYPEAVRLTTDGTQALVASNSSPGLLAVVDIDPGSSTYHTVVTTINLTDNGSLGVGVHPDGKHAMALSQLPEPGSAVIIDLSTQTITGRATPTVTGPAPVLRDMVFTPDGSRGYASVFLSDNADNMVVMSSETQTFTDSIALNLPHEGGGPGEMVMVAGKSGTTLWVTNNSVKTSGVTVLDVDTDAVLTYDDIGKTDGSIPGICADSAGARVFVAAGRVPLMTYDVETRTRTNEHVELSSHYDCVVSPDDAVVFVATSTGEILKIDMRRL